MSKKELKEQIKDTICNICEYWYSDYPAYEMPMRCHCSGDCSQEWIIEDIIKIFEQASYLPIQAGEDGLITKQGLIATYYGIEVNNDLDEADYMVERLRRIAKAQKSLTESQAKQKQAEAIACKHNITGKLIEIAGKQYKEFGTKEYEPDYSKLEQIVHKQVTGEGINYCYLEYLICCECDTILEKNEVYTV